MLGRSGRSWRRGCAAAGILLATCVPASLAANSEPHGPPTPAPTASATEGTFVSDDEGDTIRVWRLHGDTLRVLSRMGWEGRGVLEGTSFRGMFLFRSGPPSWNGISSGSLTIDAKDPRSLRLTVREIGPDPGTFQRTYRRVTDDRASFVEPVIAKQPPEPLTRVPPSYPDAAREKRIQGQVVVMALVLRDGRVGDTRMLKSIPGLDEAAQDAVRQWVFKPALDPEGRPVAVWIAIPVRFSLH